MRCLDGAATRLSLPMASQAETEAGCRMTPIPRWFWFAGVVGMLFVPGCGEPKGGSPALASPGDSAAVTAPALLRAPLGALRQVDTICCWFDTTTKTWAGGDSIRYRRGAVLITIRTHPMRDVLVELRRDSVTLSTAWDVVLTEEEPEPQPLPDPTPLAPGIPFGPNAMFVDSTLRPYTEAFTMSFGTVSPSVILPRLAVARSRGMRLFVNFTGEKRSNYLSLQPNKLTADPADSVLAFDSAKWKRSLDRYRPLLTHIQPYIDDSTLIGNNVMDEPFNWGGPGNEQNSWGPKGWMTKVMVDSLCAYAKTMFPKLPQMVTHDHGNFDPTNVYRVCTGFTSQYRYGKGPLLAFRDAGLALARRDSIAVAFAFNYLDGGTRDTDNDGIWECPQPATGGNGTYYPNCRATPAQVEEVGKVLGVAGCAYTGFRYDEAMMSQEAYRQAWRDVGAVLKAKPFKFCKRS
jgi:hypothetical protein